ncbi:hypothetical protein ZWY2020_016545 [Hordeum vulgare]|nr:hypothetical protein ZWY2020_016545 [Hordeum vulgare]
MCKFSLSREESADEPLTSQINKAELFGQEKSTTRTGSAPGNPWKFIWKLHSSPENPRRLWSLRRSALRPQPSPQPNLILSSATPVCSAETLLLLPSEILIHLALPELLRVRSVARPLSHIITSPDFRRFYHLSSVSSGPTPAAAWILVFKKLPPRGAALQGFHRPSGRWFCIAVSDIISPAVPPGEVLYFLGASGSSFLFAANGRRELVVVDLSAQSARQLLPVRRRRSPTVRAPLSRPPKLMAQRVRAPSPAALRARTAPRALSTSAAAAEGEAAECIHRGAPRVDLVGGGEEKGTRGAARWRACASPRLSNRKEIATPHLGAVNSLQSLQVDDRHITGYIMKGDVYPVEPYESLSMNQVLDAHWGFLDDEDTAEVEVSVTIHPKMNLNKKFEGSHVVLLCAALQA